MLDDVLPGDIAGDEGERLLALRRSGLLESGTDLMLDAVVHRAAILFNVPIAAVSLRDGTRQVLRSSVGFGLPFSDRDLAICCGAVIGKEPFYLLNAQSDSRFAGNTVVQGRPGIRFFAGAPVFGPDKTFAGALCVMDRRARPRVLPEELVALKMLAAEAAAFFAKRVIEVKPERSW
jgi:GAF domain-containing protein